MNADTLFNKIKQNAKDFDAYAGDNSYREENGKWLEEIKKDFGEYISAIEGDADSRDCWVYLKDEYISDEMECHTIHERTFEECYDVLSHGISKAESLNDAEIDYATATPEDIDDFNSQEAFNKTKELTDPEEIFDGMCYSSAVEFMSAVSEETSKDFLNTMLAVPAERNYRQYVSPEYRDKYTTEDFLNKIISYLENERGIKFNFNKED